MDKDRMKPWHSATGSVCGSTLLPYHSAKVLGNAGPAGGPPGGTAGTGAAAAAGTAAGGRTGIMVDVRRFVNDTHL